MTLSNPLNPETLKKGILRGKRRDIARAITLTESQRPEDQKKSRELQQLLTPHTGRSVKIGISGIPGVGKSTLIENLGLRLLSDDPARKVGVLAVDPSSPVRGGSLLGDKTRMEQLSQHPGTFIRPSPGGSGSGGVTRSCRESMEILDAAGYGVILVETIGVGQAEHLVASMVDLFVLLHMPHTGDELQGMKKGTLELAEIIIINKADGDLSEPARKAREEHRRAMQLLSKKQSWTVPVLLMSSQDNTEKALTTLTETIDQFFRHQHQSGLFLQKRKHQLSDWFSQELLHQLELVLHQRKGYEDQLKIQRERTLQGQSAPGKAAWDLLSSLF